MTTRRLGAVGHTEPKNRRTEEPNCVSYLVLRFFGFWNFLLDVLNHLPHPFDGGFHLDHVPGDFGVVGFGADGVGFAEHFLHEKV